MNTGESFFEKYEFGILWLLIIMVAVGTGIAGLMHEKLTEKPPTTNPGGQDCPDGNCPVQWIESLADVPPEFRQPNYSPYGSGSCVHASTITILKFQGEYELAEFWRDSYHSGEYADRLIKRLDEAGLKFAYTSTGSVEFLEWAARNRRVLGIFYFPAHAVNLVDLNENEAVLLDNNRTGNYIRISREEFISNWRHRYGGFAWGILDGNPPPPWPHF